jgi:hypothetical protein
MIHKNPGLFASNIVKFILCTISFLLAKAIIKKLVLAHKTSDALREIESREAAALGFDRRTYRNTKKISDKH